MQRPLSFAIAALCGAFVVAPAGAQPQADATAAPPTSPVEALMQQDTDGDGKVSLAESMAPETSRFKEMDANADGFVTAEEASAAFKARVPPEALEKMKERGMPDFGEIFLKRLDANGDGKVDLEEHGQPIEASFKVVDTDGDGFATKAEIEVFVAEMQKRAKEQAERMQQQPAPEK